MIEDMYPFGKPDFSRDAERIAHECMQLLIPEIRLRLEKAFLAGKRDELGRMIDSREAALKKEECAAVAAAGPEKETTT